MDQDERALWIAVYAAAWQHGVPTWLSGVPTGIDRAHWARREATRAVVALRSVGGIELVEEPF